MLDLRNRPIRRVVGLLSGTSADGIDAALVEVCGVSETTRAHLLAFETTPFEEPLRTRLLTASRATGSELCELDFTLGEAFARAVLSVAHRAGLPPSDVDLVGSHGQTASHQPRSAGATGATLQIGEAAVIAERVGAPVVCDFRVRDVAAGGEGAPLVPLADFYLFRQPGSVRALQNIGGIANVTVVTDHLDGVFAFDNGPGNMPLDVVAHVASDGKRSYDTNGEWAARGRIDRALLEELHKSPFFDRPPPRSTGREAFGEEWLAPLLTTHQGQWEDLLATLTRFTAEAIRRSYAEYVDTRVRVSEVLISGGGVHNRTLMGHLQELFAPIPVRSTSDAGIDPDAKEAMAFAILANETMYGLPGNLPAATGAIGPRVLGKIVLP
ncbi:MAG: anhydro-N-acetylmuramic acid kinase [Deltaproteobacteria bacterium]|nr:anhydro-N-acetylmuramic acid kinase [Deltaproteobacteria bacterium]